jgi:two-component system, NtrC family, response regulator GlrR
MMDIRRSRNTRPHVLIVDDDQELCELLALRLENNRYKVTTEGTAKGAIERLSSEQVDGIILDLRLRDADGLDVLTQIQQRTPDAPVVILTAHGTIETAVEAMRRGAWGFITKPFHDHELLQKLAHAVENAALRREVKGLRRIVGASSEDAQLIGTSRALARVREVIKRVAPTDVTVLITGESGTGKELAARSLHAMSPRGKGPFVALNCGAIPPDLLESELFGHTKGAFTGATKDRSGLFAAAHGATLFLDEIGDASLAVQVKLLRVLQERRYTPVGSTVEEEADVRVIAATNRDLHNDVAAGRFREDLFFRLHVVPLAMPSLRERLEDVPLLAEVFLERAAARHGFAVPHLSRAALDVLLAHGWPGNVRELGNVMEAALLLAGADELRPEHLMGLTTPLSLRSPPASAPQLAPDEGSAPRSPHCELLTPLTNPDMPLPPLKEARDAFERLYLIEALKRVSGNVSAAARVAGRNRTDFYELLRRHGISPTEFKE